MMGSVNNVCSKIAYYYDFDQWDWRGVCSKVRIYKLMTAKKP
jgi:hypothetical protein